MNRPPKEKARLAPELYDLTPEQLLLRLKDDPSLNETDRRMLLIVHHAGPQGISVGKLTRQLNLINAQMAAATMETARN
jgi:hypothetical protein